MTVERIGVLMVHGIGTNPPNQFLVDQTRKIVAAMSEEVASIDVLAEPAVEKKVPDTYRVDYAANIVKVEAKTKGDNPRTLQIDFNEVYWADLGEKPTLGNQVKFWFWALSMWSVAARDRSPLDGAKDMYKPKGGGIRPWERPLLGFYGILFLLGACTIGLYNVIADRVKLPRVPISDILTAYLGDVMLYSESDGADDPAVCDFALPPRVGIRARMVDALIEFAMRDYDRWFLFAHSQGTVVAYNGLMETASALPNYLTRARWAQASAKGLAHPQPAAVTGPMLPRRPTWLQPTDGIGRRKLFAKLGGLLTYGSAIGKFRGIWPIIVPANKDEHVFEKSFRWVNVYDWTDPVSGPLRAYTREQGFDAKGARLAGQDPVVRDRVAAKIDVNISYRSGWVWLLSHLQYLNYAPRAYQRPDPLLVTEVAGWVLGREPRWQALTAKAPLAFIRYPMALGEALLATIVVWLSTAALLRYLVADKWISWLESSYLPVLALVALLVGVVADVAGGAWRKLSDQRNLPRWTRWIVVALATGSIACLSVRTFHDCVWVQNKIAGMLACFTHWFGHPHAIAMSVGLMSLTITLIVALGGIRWLFQPIPVHVPDPDRNNKPKNPPETVAVTAR